MLPPRLIRRLVLAPLVVVIALAFIVLSPFLALLALMFGLAASHIEFLRNGPDDDDAVAACYHGDTPDQTDRSPPDGQQRLNGKLSPRRKLR